MAGRSTLLIALLLALIFLLLPASRQASLANFSLSHSLLASRNLHIAIYRFRSGAVPFCELYFHFTTQYLTAPVRSRHPEDVWDRIDSPAQLSGYRSCRSQDNSFVL